MSNQLAGETSPYLLQHANNPVNWYPWGEMALALAHKENKPILLSIGYSACHWCHVMAHESFEDTAIAAAMNQHFINIKVDREERPDLDQIYQAAHYMLTKRNGGWPLTLFLTPDQKPFFGGTYFPKTSRHGLPGFLDLLPRVAKTYYIRGAEIEQQSASLLEAFVNTLPLKSMVSPELSEKPIKKALAEISERFDPVYGGFGDAPKFFHPTELELCLRHHYIPEKKEVLLMVSYTLEKMANGGIYDQIGGGFYRYSTDQHWGIPHFEKMLYDNGPLLRLYANTWLITGDPLFKKIAEETAEWVIREMQSPNNTASGYYSTIDADSEHEEGKFYVWNRDQIINVLTQEEYAVVAPHYGLERPPNFEREHWNLEVVQPLVEIAQIIGVAEANVHQKLTSARKKLFIERELRIRPFRDEKILTGWNGLMIKGMANAGRIFKRGDWIRSAMLSVDFIQSELWKDGCLFASYKDDKVHLKAYLDDYAFMLDSLLELMQAEFRQTDLNFAVALAETLLEKFEDKEAGGFFFTSHDHEKLIHRPKSSHDNATPAGNGVAAYALQRLGHIVGESRYLQTAESTLSLFYSAMSRHASPHCSLLMALEEILTPPQIIILTGQISILKEWQSALQHSTPRAIVIALPAGLIGMPPSLHKIQSPGTLASAWVCQGTVCLPEIFSLEELQHTCKFQDKIAPSLLL